MSAFTPAESRAFNLLTEGQRKWFLDTAKLQVIEKGRRTGITWTEAARNTVRAAKAKSRGGCNVYYISYNADMCLEYIEAVAMWAKALNHVAGEIEETIWKDNNKEDIRVFTIKFGSGHRIVALTSRPENLRGKQGVVVIDEAAFCGSLDELMKAALALTIWGGEVHIISTHNGENNPFNRLVMDMRAGKQRGSLHSYFFPTAIEQGIYRKICQRTGAQYSKEAEAAFVKETYELYRANANEELNGTPSAGQLPALTRAQVNACARKGVPVYRFDGRKFDDAGQAARKIEIDRMCKMLAPAINAFNRVHRCHFGMDVARRGDLSVIWLQHTIKLQRDASLVIELRKMPFDMQCGVLWYVIDSARASGGAIDSTGLGAELAEKTRQRYGRERIAEVHLTEAWYRENMGRVIVGVEDHDTTLPADDFIIDDLLSIERRGSVYRIPDGQSGIGPDKEKRHADSAVAKALADFAQATITAGPIEFQSVGPRDATLSRGGWGVAGRLDFGGF